MYAVAAFAFGLVFGSFLNVCIYRMPKHQSVVGPRSQCPHCRHLIRWHDNVPVVSYLILKGKCRDCGVPISPRYLAVEILTAVTFSAMMTRFGLTPAGFVYLALTMALIVETFIDLEYQIIPDAITLPGLAIGIAASAAYPALHGQSLWWQGLAVSAAGALAGGGMLYLTGTLTEWVIKKEALGGGDVKLLALIGAVIGPLGAFWAVFAASVLGSFVGIYLRVRRGREQIPFGPYLAAGAILYLFVGRASVDAYLRFIHLN